MRAEPAKGHGAHQKDSRYETPALCHFQRQVHFVTRRVRSSGHISCCCRALFCWKVEDKSLMPASSPHTARPCPGRAWRHLRRLYPCGSAGKRIGDSAGDLGSIPGLGSSPGEGKGYLLHYSCLENSTDCVVHGVSKSGTRLSDFHTLPAAAPPSPDPALPAEGAAGSTAFCLPQQSDR